MKLFAGQAALVAVALKELIHVWRDRRILTLIVFLPPIFTLLLGHAFEVEALKDVPAILLNKDRSKESAELVNLLSSKDIFVWRQPKDIEGDKINLSQNKLQVAIIIPPGWGVGLHNGSPIPLQLVLDGADTNSAPEIQGAVQQILGEYQSRSLETMIDDLPEEVSDLGRKLPEFVRKNFSSSMSPWAVKSRLLFLPCVSRNKHLFRRHR
jgi:ABC-2 type transport system permease protein